MNIRRDPTRSRIARRIVALFVLCALAPVTALAILSYDHVRSLLVHQGSIQLAQSNEAYSTALYDRLLSVQLQLRETANGPGPWGGELREHLKIRFDALMRIPPDRRRARPPREGRHNSENG